MTTEEQIKAAQETATELMRDMTNQFIADVFQEEAEAAAEKAEELCKTTQKIAIHYAERIADWNANAQDSKAAKSILEGTWDSADTNLPAELNDAREAAIKADEAAEEAEQQAEAARETYSNFKKLAPEDPYTSGNVDDTCEHARNARGYANKAWNYVRAAELMLNILVKGAKEADGHI